MQINVQCMGVDNFFFLIHDDNREFYYYYLIMQKIYKICKSNILHS
jgi:hypothetical protein